MIVLGIDSSTDQLGIGLADDTKIIAEALLESKREHASRIIGMIDTTITDSSISKADLDGVAVAIGPGSFTGLRVGLATAKGMALALEIPIVGISTFAVMAQRLKDAFDIFYLSALVRKGEFYLWRATTEHNPEDNINIVTGEKLSEAVGSHPIGFVGHLPEDWTELVDNPISQERLCISGGELALKGAKRIGANDMDDPASLEPLYIAPSQAERKLGLK
jgi:tRNA threonylcarbamoyladenosine biosynthesis protein TsaB